MDRHGPADGPSNTTQLAATVIGVPEREKEQKNVNILNKTKYRLPLLTISICIPGKVGVY